MKAQNKWDGLRLEIVRYCQEKGILERDFRFWGSMSGKMFMTGYWKSLWKINMQGNAGYIGRMWRRVFARMSIGFMLLWRVGKGMPRMSGLKGFRKL